MAIKALNGHYTSLMKKGLVRELEALTKMSEHQPRSPHYLNILSSLLMIPGKGGAGEHTCFVAQLLGGDLNALWKFGGHGKPFPFNLAKRILLTCYVILMRLESYTLISNTITSSRIGRNLTLLVSTLRRGLRGSSKRLFLSRYPFLHGKSFRTVSALAGFCQTSNMYEATTLSEI